MSTWFPVRVAGDSMRPTLRPGELLAVRPCARDEPRARQVVVVRRGTQEDVKRVIRRLEDGSLWVEGDNAAASTDSRTYGALSPEDVVGVVRMRYWPVWRARVF